MDALEVFWMDKQEMIGHGKNSCWFNPDDYDVEYPEDAYPESGWFYWYCYPGCLPEGDPIGPFETELEAYEAEYQLFGE